MNRRTEIGINIKIINGLVFIFVLFLAVGLALQNQKIAVVAVALAILPLFFFLVIFRFELMGLLTALVIPLSVTAPVGAGAVSFPGETLVLTLAIFYLFFSLNRNGFLVSKVLKHPITILILLDLIWSLFTGLIGEFPIISLKRMLIKGMFIAVFYFFFIALFQKKENIVRIWILYGVGLIIPILWTLYNHSRYEFSQVVSFEMPPPFYNDHTLYAACIAFILPLFILFTIKPKWFGFQKKWRFLFLGIGLLLLIGEYFSYSRAAWLSIILAALSGLLIVFLRFKAVHFIILILVSTIILSFYSQDIYQRVAKVDDVSRKEDVEEHLRSAMNIQTDVSNLERINRWQCALRMFRDKPVTGFGPGTYLFVYAKYQITPEMTRISTNHGEKGNAHSEYLMYLSETGFPGLLIFLLLILLVVTKAIRIFNSTKDKRLKWLTFSILLGFISYLIHGLFNSFIDTDKAAILFYTAIAAVVSIDQYHDDKDSPTLQIHNPDPGKQTNFSAKES